MSKQQITIHTTPTATVQIGNGNTMHVGTGLADLSAERYAMQADAFLSYIAEHVNPARVEAALAPVSDVHARALFRLVTEWDKRLRGLPHALDT